MAVEIKLYEDEETQNSWLFYLSTKDKNGIFKTLKAFN